MDSKCTPHDLTARAQAGDRAAFEQLVHECRGELERFLRLRLGEHLKQDIEFDDVLQETYARAFRSVDRFRWHNEDSLIKWLRGIAEHVILEVARRHNRRRMVYLEGDPACRDISPSTSLRREERFARLKEAIDGLSPDYRRVVVLSRIHGLRIDEIARRMERSPKAVAHLLARALRVLKESFGGTESMSLPPNSIEDKEEPDAQ